MGTLKVEIDKDSGFCFGVVKAIETAEKQLKDHQELYCLGDIVHNSKEVNRLCKTGMKTILHKDLNQLENKRVLIRAHGEPPATYQLAKAKNIQLIDATCPVVLRLQKRVKKAYDELKETGGQIVIYGKKGHAEVNGLLGQTQNEGIVIESENDLGKLDYTKTIFLFSQTTKSIEGFQSISREITRRSGTPEKVQTYDTICRQVAHRVPKLKLFAAQFQIIIFVSGKKSSNGKFLFDTCSKVNSNTFFVSGEEEISKEWFGKDIKTVGVCGATSTPQWLMKQIAEKIESF